VDYDIMSLMHYGDTEFGAIGSDGRPKTTMLFNGASSKTMGNRQGLTMADSKQLAKMYKCEGQLTTFTLCTSKEDSATYVPCKCHAPYFKTKKGSGYKCAANKCPDFAGGNGRTHCGCPVTCKTECFNNGGKRYCGCKDCNTATSTTPAARPPPPPTPPSTSTTAPPPPLHQPDALTVAVCPGSECKLSGQSCLEGDGYCCGTDLRWREGMCAPLTTPTTPTTTLAPATAPPGVNWTCSLSDIVMANYCSSGYPFIAASHDCHYSWYSSSASDAVSSCTNAAGYTCYVYDQYGTRCR